VRWSSPPSGGSRLWVGPLRAARTGAQAIPIGDGTADPYENADDSGQGDTELRLPEAQRVIERLGADAEDHDQHIEGPVGPALRRERADDRAVLREGMGLQGGHDPGGHADDADKT